MLVKVMTFNIQSTRDYVNRNFDPSLMAKTIEKIGGEIIGLNEVRGEGPDEFFTDQVGFIANYLGYKYYYFGKAIDIKDKGPYGNAFISKYPIENVETIMIPDPLVKDEDAYYETRCIIRARVRVNGELITILVIHVGLARSEEENALKVIHKLIDEEKGKLILMGDFNMVPETPLIKSIGEKMFDTVRLMEEPVLTFPSIDSNRKIDYIFTKNINVKKARVERIVASDHFPCSMDIEL